MMVSTACQVKYISAFWLGMCWDRYCYNVPVCWWCSWWCFKNASRSGKVWDQKKKIFIRLWISINPRLFVSCFEFIYAAYLCRLLRPHGIYLLVHPLSSKFTLFLNANKMIIWREIVFLQITYGAPKERLQLVRQAGCSWSIALYIMRKFETLPSTTGAHSSCPYGILVSEDLLVTSLDAKCLSEHSFLICYFFFAKVLNLLLLSFSKHKGYLKISKDSSK